VPAKLFRLFNLIVSHEPWPGEERRTLRIVQDILGRVRVFDTPRNLLLLKVDEPFEAVRKLEAHLGPEDPVLRAIPLDGETAAYAEDVRDAVVEVLREKLGDKRPRFAIRLEGRLWSRETGQLLHKDEAISIIAEPIDLPVNLNNPEVIVLIKPVRLHRAQRYAGIMIGSPNAVYSRARKWRRA